MYIGVSVDGSTKKYYTKNRQHFEERWNSRNFVTEYDTMKDIELEPTSAAKSRRCAETGYTGLSLLSNLNFLYGFDPFKDLTHDVMHLVCLNLTRKLFKRIFTKDDFNLEAFGNELENFPFTSGNFFNIPIDPYFSNVQITSNLIWFNLSHEMPSFCKFTSLKCF